MNLEKLLSALSEEERRETLRLLQREFCHPANLTAVGSDEGLQTVENWVKEHENIMSSRLRKTLLKRPQHYIDEISRKHRGFGVTTYAELVKLRGY
ncbi:hypothetical protein [Parapedobacter tibetensis]|uniref:hypothetical protein n=1 Tax=Parapedobacter tibetensis TaxID=2972951 RepID=UPI00214D3688|nr:hypothetical protein [Parapedobacter tibetensis]